MSLLQRLFTTAYAATKSTDCQHIVMDQRGRIIESDDQLFSTKNLLHSPVTAWNHLVESIFPMLLQLPPQSPELCFQRVEADHLELLPGFYDFSFRCIKGEKKDEKYIVWRICDRTHHYQNLQDDQQANHDKEILRQLENRGNY